MGWERPRPKRSSFALSETKLALEPNQGDYLWLLPGSQDVLVHQLVLIMIKLILFIYLVHFSVEYLLDH